MADLETFGEQASQYVLGQLPEPERREFEARLADSVELRALVGELEEGLCVMAMTAPQRQPSRQIWKQIEKKLSRENRGEAVAAGFWTGLWRHGWGAAGACLVLWLAYAWWVTTNQPSGVTPVTAVSNVISHPPATDADPQPAESQSAVASATPDVAQQLLQARTQEINALSRQVADLSKQVTDLAQDLSNKNVLLADPSRLKFFQLAAVPGSANGAAGPAPIPGNLQRALFLAMARELGWAPEALKNAGGGAVNSQTGGTHPSTGVATNFAGVDFVDLRSGSGESGSVPNSSSTSEAPGTLTASLTNAIPGFVSGTNAVLAFDPAVLPTGSSLTFVTLRSWASQSSMGTVVLGNNPTVVTVPLDATVSQGGNVTVILSTSAGASSIIGQFPVAPAAGAR